MKEILWRTPFSFFAAFGLLSISTGAGVMTLDDAILGWIAIWNAITHPIWETLFWPLKAWLEWAPPWWLKDYLSLGVIFYGMTRRAERVEREFLQAYSGLKPTHLSPQHAIFIVCTSVVLWPFRALVTIERARSTDRSRLKRSSEREIQLRGKPGLLTEVWEMRQNIEKTILRRLFGFCCSSR